MQADASYSILRRMVRATQVDTVLHTHLEVDSTRSSSRRIHEVNVIGTMNLLAAAAAEGSAVRKIVLKTSTLIYGSNFADPYFFRETPAARTRRPPRWSARWWRSTRSSATSPRTTPRWRSRRCASPTCSATTSPPCSRACCACTAVPEVFGYDPRLQFVHEDDVTRALAHAIICERPGTFNVAGPGTITWGEACRAVSRRRLAMPPVFTGAARLPLRLLRVIDIPPEVLSLLRYGRGVDTNAFVDTGFEYLYTTPATVERVRAGAPVGAGRRPASRVRVRARRGGLPPQLRGGGAARGP